MFILFLTLLFVLIIHPTLGSQENITVHIDQQFMYDVDMTNLNGSSSGTLFLTFFSDHPVNITKKEITVRHINKEEFSYFNPKNHTNEILIYNNDHYTFNNLINLPNESFKVCKNANKSNCIQVIYGLVLIPGEPIENDLFKHNFTLINNSITSLSENINSLEIRKWEMYNSTYEEQGLFLTYVPTFQVNYNFSVPDTKNITTNRTQVNLINNDYNFSKFMYSSRIPNYIFAENKITSIVWELPLNHTKHILIHSVPDEATKEKAMDEATNNSEILGEKAELLGYIGLVLGLISIALAICLEWKKIIKESKNCFGLFFLFCPIFYCVVLAAIIIVLFYILLFFSNSK